MFSDGQSQIQQQLALLDLQGGMETPLTGYGYQPILMNTAALNAYPLNISFQFTYGNGICVTSFNFTLNDALCDIVISMSHNRTRTAVENGFAVIASVSSLDPYQTAHGQVTGQFLPGSLNPDSFQWVPKPREMYSAFYRNQGWNGLNCEQDYITSYDLPDWYVLGNSNATALTLCTQRISYFLP